MTKRILLAGLAVLALALPTGVAGATHCTTGFGGQTDLIIFTGTGVVVNAGAVGCIVDPSLDTDILTAGATQMQVRWLQANAPLNGTVTLVGVTAAACPGGVCTLTFHPNGALWDSQVISVSPASTIAGGTATAYACFLIVAGNCTDSVTHQYRTAA